MAQIINYTRVTTSDRLEDRFLTCQVYEPSDIDQASAGKIFSQIEILSPWFPASQIGQTVINTLIREYYRGSSGSDLQNFEGAIKKVNEALAQIAQNGETEWIGKFSGILMLSRGKNIHIAQTGNSRAYLFRGSRINHITEGLSQGDAPHPLKTFTNLTSGELQEGDRIIIGNSTVFDIFSPAELRIPATSYLPMMCAMEIARGLKRRGAHTGNAIVLEMTTKEQLANIAPEQKVDTVYLDQSGFDIGYLIKNISNNCLKLIGYLSKNISNARKYTKNNISPKIKKTLESSKKEIGSMASRASEGLKSSKVLSGTSAKPEATENFQTSIVSNNQQLGLNKKIALKKSFGLKSLSLVKVRNKIKRLLISSGIYGKNKTKLITWSIVAVVVILLISIAISLNLKKSNEIEQALAAKSAKITSLSGEASLLISRNQKDEAIDKLNELLDLSDELKGTDYEDSVNRIVEDSNRKLISIAKITNVKVDKEFTIDESAQSLNSINETLFYFKKSDGIFSKNKDEEKFNIIINQEYDAESISSTSLENEKDIAFLLENHKIILADTQSFLSKELNVEVSSGNVIRQYLDSLYILDTDNNQIWKIPKTDDGYLDTQRYIRDETVVALYNDMAIDGSIYLLNEQCDILKFARGRAEDQFKVDTPGTKEIDGGCKRIFASSSQDNVFVLRETNDKIVIIQMNKSGDYQKQFIIDKPQTIRDFSFSHQPRSLFIKTQDKILKYNL